MLINHEVPIKCLEQATFNDYGYALAHNFTDAQYREYFINLSKDTRTYLDNSAFELGHSIDPAYLKQCADLLDRFHTRVFLPDVPGDAQKTISMSREFASYIEGQVWGVIQGKTDAELRKCLEALLKLTDNIAIPYRNIDRVKFLHDNKDLLKYYNVQVHLLGLASMHELAELSGNEFVFSIDTSLPVVLGLKGITLTMDSIKDPTPVWDFDVDELPDLVFKNAEFFRKIANGGK